MVKRTLSGHSGYVNACAFSPRNPVTGKSPMVVSASDDTTLKIWNAVTGDLISTLVGHSAGVASCSWVGPEMVKGQMAADSQTR